MISTFRPMFNIAKVFSQFDSDNSGALSVGEMRTAFQAMGFSEELCNDVFSQIDVNQDGEIELSEWREKLDTKMYQRYCSQYLS